MVHQRSVHYPSSDDQPMAETEEHADSMFDLIHSTRAWLADPLAWHVHGNQLFYYVEGDSKRSFSPDVYVIRGIPQFPKRLLWKLWEEPSAVPALVIELTSKTSVARDLGPKRELYAQLGVEEYVVFDVLRHAKHAPLRLWRHDGERLVEQSDLHSTVLGLDLRADGPALRLVRPDGSLVPLPLARAEEEAKRAEEQTMRADEEAKRADEAVKRADEQAMRVGEEAKRAMDLASELATALAELQRLRDKAD